MYTFYYYCHWIRNVIMYCRVNAFGIVHAFYCADSIAILRIAKYHEWPKQNIQLKSFYSLWWRFDCVRQRADFIFQLIFEYISYVKHFDIYFKHFVLFAPSRSLFPSFSISLAFFLLFTVWCHWRAAKYLYFSSPIVSM